MNDPVNHPAHYTAHPSGVECIQITEHMGFCLGNAVKYIWRADLKDDALEDLRKAAWYIDREIARRTKDTPPLGCTDSWHAVAYENRDTACPSCGMAATRLEMYVSAGRASL